MIKSIGIIGFGQFGQFMHEHLHKHFKVLAYDPNVRGDSSYMSSLEEVCACKMVVFAVPAQELEGACREAVEHIKESTLIIDVTSVKVKPLQVLQKYFPNNKILGTHPIFGPQSGKDGIENLPIVLCNLSLGSSEYDTVKSFLTDSLRLKVIERTPEEHDKEMAEVMGLSHFIGRALNNLKIKDYETNTKTYHHLVELTGIIGQDTWELFQTIQNENPYSKEVRESFLDELNNLERKLT